MRTEVMNFTKACEVEVSSREQVLPGDASATKLVTLNQHSGSMAFQFDMHPAQARELAHWLVWHADRVEVAV